MEIFSKMKIGLNSRFFLNYPQKQTKNHLFIAVSFTMAHGHHFLKVLPVRGEMDHETHKSSMEPPRGLFVCLHTRPESSSFVLMELCVLCMPFYTRLCTARGFSASDFPTTEKVDVTSKAITVWMLLNITIDVCFLSSQ